MRLPMGIAQFVEKNVKDVFCTRESRKASLDAVIIVAVSIAMYLTSGAVVNHYDIRDAWSSTNNFGWTWWHLAPLLVVMALTWALSMSAQVLAAQPFRPPRPTRRRRMLSIIAVPSAMVILTLLGMLIGALAGQQMDYSMLLNAFNVLGLTGTPAALRLTQPKAYIAKRSMYMIKRPV